MAIQLRRGTNAQWEALKSNIVVGELATTYDSERAFLGTGDGTYFEMANIELIADEFDSSTSYAEGDVCIYQGKLYQFTAGHSGAWSGTDVEQVTASEVGSGGTAISDLQDNALIHRTASGAIASFSDGSTMPMDSLTVDINPVQSGSGDPSPTNVRAISGWDSVDVNVAGKNLFDNVWESGIINGTTGQNTANSSYRRGANYLKVTPNTAYSFSYKAETDLPILVYIYDETKTYIGTASIAVGNGRTYTTNADTHYIRVRPRGTISEIPDPSMQIELSTTATSYEPYNGNTTTVSLGQTVYGGSLNVTSGVLTIDRAMAVLDGSEDEVWFDYPSYNGYLTEALTQLMAIGLRQDGVCNMLKDSKTTASGQTGAFWLGVNNKRFYAIGVKDSMGATVEEFRSFLSNEPLQIVFPLATPTTVQLTPTQIQTLLGQNNVWADSGDVEVTYTANASLTIEEIINAITALGGNV